MKQFEDPAINITNADIESESSDNDKIEVTDCDISFFDEEEIHQNCTVVIWKNSKTGEESVGWYENVDEEPGNGDYE